LRAQALSRGASSGSGLKHSDSVSAELTRAVQLDTMFAAAWGRLASELLGSVFSYSEADTSRLSQASVAIRTACESRATLLSRPVPTNGASFTISGTP